MFVSWLMGVLTCDMHVYQLVICCGLYCVCLSARSVLWIALCEYLGSWGVVACVIFVPGLVDIVAYVVVYVTRLDMLLLVLYVSRLVDAVACVVYA